MHFDLSVQLSHKKDTKCGNENHTVTKHKASTKEIEHNTTFKEQKGYLPLLYFAHKIQRRKYLG